MNAKKIVKLSNLICIISVLLLCLWVFTFIIMEVFSLKVFRENLTQTFYLSILGILALMFGALITNVVFNLSRIADKHNNDPEPGKKTGSRIPVIIFLAAFPVIALFLFTGDCMSSAKRRQILVQAGQSIAEDNSLIIGQLADYHFTLEWLSNAKNKMSLLSRFDKNYRDVSIIVKDEIDSIPVYLLFGSIYFEEDKLPAKIRYVMDTDLEQRTYLDKVFNNGYLDKKFTASDGRYEMFYPVRQNGKTIVLYFRQQQAYGKIGS